MFCENCGNKIDENSEFCMECGHRLAPENLNNTNIGDKQPLKIRLLPSALALFIVPVIIALTLLLTQAFVPYKQTIIQIDNSASGDNNLTNTSNALSSETSSVTRINPWDIIFTCTASSSLGINKWGENFNPQSANDGDSETAWYEGANDYGINEWLQLDFYQDCEISGIALINGQAMKKDDYKRFYANARVKKVRIEAANGFSEEHILHDGVTNFQDLYFSNPVVTDFVRIVILEVYPGDADMMTGFSEVKLL